jgi:hypothetical protein
MSFFYPFYQQPIPVKQVWTFYSIYGIEIAFILIVAIAGCF